MKSEIEKDWVCATCRGLVRLPLRAAKPRACSACFAPFVDISEAATRMQGDSNMQPSSVMVTRITDLSEAQVANAESLQEMIFVALVASGIALGALPMTTVISEDHRSGFYVGKLRVNAPGLRVGDRWLLRPASFPYSKSRGATHGIDLQKLTAHLCRWVTVRREIDARAAFQDEKYCDAKEAMLRILDDYRLPWHGVTVVATVLGLRLVAARIDESQVCLVLDALGAGRDKPLD